MKFSLENIRPPIAVAVSGGADSLALALLAHSWARTHQGECIALTVDHGLRSDSASEAEQVNLWLTARGIKHITLSWEGEKPLTHLQEKAREARYKLLLSWCKAHHIPTLLLGHHQQDQEETFWLRLRAGSGLEGLTGMRAQTVREGIKLVRPFLRRTKEELKAFLKTQNQEWIEDPSNEDPRFFRSKLRAVLQQEGLSSGRLENTLGKLQEDLDFIQENLRNTLISSVSVHEEGGLSIEEAAFRALHPSLAKRLISVLIHWFSPSVYPPRSEKVRGILEKLRARAPFTAGGIYWLFQRNRLYLGRELAATAPPLFLKTLESETLWDQRFFIAPELKTLFPDEAYLAPLGGGLPPPLCLSELPLPARLFPTLPTLWVKEKIAAIPHLCYTSPGYRKDGKKFISIKPLFHDSLRFTI